MGLIHRCFERSAHLLASARDAPALCALHFRASEAKGMLPKGPSAAAVRVHAKRPTEPPVPCAQLVFHTMPLLCRAAAPRGHRPGRVRVRSPAGGLSAAAQPSQVAASVLPRTHKRRSSGSRPGWCRPEQASPLQQVPTACTTPAAVGRAASTRPLKYA